MKIIRTLKKNRNSILSLVCLIALFFAYGCQCQGEVGTKSGDAGGISASSSIVDKK